MVQSQKLDGAVVTVQTTLPKVVRLLGQFAPCVNGPTAFNSDRKSSVESLQGGTSKIRSLLRSSMSIACCLMTGRISTCFTLALPVTGSTW